MGKGEGKGWALKMKLPTTIYEGQRSETKIMVSVDGFTLLVIPSLRLRNHSPDGFNWGYGGSGPAQLALAILLDYAGEEIALKYYQTFKRNTVAHWGDLWRITGKEIDSWLERTRKIKWGL